MTPRVTVIVATYNWSAVLRCAVASVLDQTFSDFELLVVGDGCTDDSGQVVAAFGDSRVRWINLPANTRHQSGPNNEGLRQARGEIIAYLGHDDLWLPHHLASVVPALDGSKSDLAYGLGIKVAVDGALRLTLPQPARGGFSLPLCMVHRRCVTEEIGGWRNYRELIVNPEVELWQRAQAGGYTLTFVPRLIGIKFPASCRRDVYVTRPSGQQEHWLARIQSEPDLEARLLVQALIDDVTLVERPYRELVGGVLHQTRERIRQRLTMFTVRSPGPGEIIDRIRRFKGVGD